MSDNIWRKLLSYFDTCSSVSLNETEKVGLKRSLSQYKIDSEMLAVADEGDFQAVFPQEWSGKKRNYYFMPSTIYKVINIYGHHAEGVLPRGDHG